FTEETIGNIKTNIPIGIYGDITEKINKNIKYEISENSEVKTGKAKLITTVSGTEPKEYDIEITYICTHNKNTNRNFVLKITDKRLLKKTGGIVQGMSGSPIIQNGKFAGALTHVFLDDCKRGYGIFAENMIQN
ncbi:MAG: SpoIVB peptidase, partial [Ruminococcus sp.]|nr:SpoIVB peptidase [Ruminococcus sp.]